MVNLQQYCHQLSNDLGIAEDPIQEEAPGVYSLPIAEEMTIKMSSQEEGVSFYCILCDCPKVNTDVFFTDVMDGNLYGSITRNNVLGLTEDGNQLTLSRTIDYNIDYKGFNEILQDFYNVALFWREHASAQLKTNK